MFSGPRGERTSDDASFSEGEGLMGTPRVNEVVQCAGEDDINPDEVEGLPESLFSYCIFQISFAPDSTRWKVFIELIILVSAELILAAAFAQNNISQVIMLGWKKPGGRVQSSCVFQGGQVSTVLTPEAGLWPYPKTLAGQPWVGIVVGLICLSLIAMSFRSDAKQLLRTAVFHEVSDRYHHIFTSWLVFIATGIHAVMLPVCVAMGTALTLSSSWDVKELLLNAFAVTFLLEIDDNLYEHVVSPEEKGTYAKMYDALKGHMGPTERDDWTPNYCYALDLSVMVLYFVYVRMGLRLFENHEGEDGSLFEDVLVSRIRLITALYVCARCLLLQLAAQGRSQGSVCSLAGVRELGTVFRHFVMTLVCIGLVYFMCFAPFFAMDPHFDYDQMYSCLSNQNDSACACA